MSERARALEQALNRAIDRTIIAHGDEVFIGEGYSGRESLLTYFAQEVAAVATPPSGASPQAETSDDLSELWRQELYPHVEPDTFKRFLCDLTAEGWDDVRKEVFALQSIVDSRPAPVSPVEPEPPTTFVAKESDAYLKYAARHLRHAVDKADDAPASSAQHEKQALFALTHERIPTHEEALNVWVEPEPPEELPCYCDIPSHILDLGCPRHQAPQCEPEPPWREKYNELLFAVARAYPGESRHDTALRYIREKETAEACGPKAVAPLAKEESADV